MSKQIILLFDGTWNDAEFSVHDTNIVRLRNLISVSLDSGSIVLPKATRGARLKPGQRIAAGRTLDSGQENLVFYERGVGTNASDRLSGGVFGEGLHITVRRAYRFLSFHYRLGDAVFIFGFSRGSYSARTLVGYIAAAGLLRREHCTAHLEALAWNFYRTTPNDRLPGVWSVLGQYAHDREHFQVDCLAVFDTVGALGVPLNLFRRINRDKFEFHSVELSTITKVNLQALAIDEHRQQFAASIWRKPRFKSLASITEQVWFPGAHADIGGGYWNDEERATRGLVLDDLALDWILKRVLHYYPSFPMRLDRAWKLVDSTVVCAPHHRSRAGIFLLNKYSVRAINNSATLKPIFFENVVCRDRNAEPIGEMIHISVLERLGQRIFDGNSTVKYAPRNAIDQLDDILASYGFGHLRDRRPTLVVDWSGVPISHLKDESRIEVRALVESARSRLVRDVSSKL